MLAYFIMPKQKKEPGWYIIDKYLPDATPEAKQEAHANLVGMLSVLVEIDDRLEKENQDKRKEVEAKAEAACAPEAALPHTEPLL